MFVFQISVFKKAEASRLPELTKDNFDQEISKGFSAVYFWSPWCSSCKSSSSMMENLAKEMRKKVKFYKVSFDTQIELCNKYNVNETPMLLLFRDGKVVASRSIGEKKESKKDIEKWIEDNRKASLVNELTKDNFDQEISNGLVAVYFYYERCDPCQMLRPEVQKLAEKMEGKIRFCKMNVGDEENNPILEKFEVFGGPTFLIFKNGRNLNRLIPKDKDQLEIWITRFLW